MGRAASELERVEGLIVAQLKARLGNDVRVEAQPDDPDNFDIGNTRQLVLVHFAGSRPATRNRATLAGPASYAVIVNARSLRGATGGYALVETCEQALAGVALPGAAAIQIVRTVLEDQRGGLWRWVIEIETQMQRGVSAAQPAIFTDQFQEGDAA